MALRILDPTHETVSSALTLAPRLKTLQGVVVGFISNGKEGTKGFFHHLERYLINQHRVANVVYRTKLSYSAPADPAIMEEVATWDLAVTGIGD